MIRINSLEDLEKFKFQKIPKKQDGKYKVYLYKFTENGELADVEFNVEIPFGLLDLQEYVKVTEHGENDLPDVEFSDIVCYSFWANNVVANKKFRVGRLYCNNAVFKEDSEIVDELRAKGKVEAKNLECVDVKVLCKEMVCDDLVVSDITCGKLQVKNLILRSNQFENITAENVNMYNDIIKNKK